MHYHCEVWLSKIYTYEEATQRVHALLEPYSYDKANARRCFYDWFQIGGRYTGRHDNYDPYTDIINYGLCNLCKGTGIRPEGEEQFGKDWVISNRGCNGCRGTGASLNFSPQPHLQDVMPLNEIKDDLTCYTLIIAKGRGREIIHDFDDFVKPFLNGRGITDGCLVTIDYHS